MILDINVVRLPHAEGLSLPRYASAGAAGADLCAAVVDDLILENGDRAAVPTGLVFEIPEGYEAQVRPRSGLALKYGIALVNAPGTIDSDYRGEVKVILINLGRESVTIKRGERIAQLVLAPVQRAAFHEVVSADSSDRGDGGFGSTGR
ncbi:MAG: dUTP diphosphatase [bacterium]|nr:dUTP diphosphatase [bacterium]